jgi:hypothetical protein
MQEGSVSTPFGPAKMFLPVLVSTTEVWICMAEPGSPAIGLAMKVAKQSWRSAASRIRRLKKKTSSASRTGSPWARFSSI